ncbi:hypothetical protein Aperf_G00000107564 [Anoplocephala perfoliata]
MIHKHLTNELNSSNDFGNGIEGTHVHTGFRTAARCSELHQQDYDVPIQCEQSYLQNYQPALVNNDASVSTHYHLSSMINIEQGRERPPFAELQPNIISNTINNNQSLSSFQSVRSENRRIINQESEKKSCKRKKRVSIEEHEEQRRLTRLRANDRERNRMHDLNRTLDDLRDCLSIFTFDRRLSKIDTLRLATNYIAFLTEKLSTQNKQPDRLNMALTLTNGLSVDSTNHIARRMNFDPRVLTQMRMNRTEIQEATNGSFLDEVSLNGSDCLKSSKTLSRIP